MSRYIDADKLTTYLKGKIKTAQSTIVINNLLGAMRDMEAGGMVTVPYSGWISVEDRLPEPGQYCLLRHQYQTVEFEPITAGYYFKDTKTKGHPRFYFYYAAINNFGDTVRAKDICPGNEFVTHWMPMPEPPEDNNDKSM